MIDTFQRFLRKIDTSTECWNWTAHKLPRTNNRQLPYGLFSVNGKDILAHRYSYETYVGKIPDGTEIDHLCKNPSCVRWDHLEAVTHRVNVIRANLHKTHCPHGHPYSGDNLLMTEGRRRCRKCTLSRSNVARNRKSKEKSRHA